MCYATFSQYSLAYDNMINTMENTATRTWTILDVEFELDELRDIVNHGMSAGVSGFIYTKDCVDKFNEHDDEIEEYLSDWYHDNMGENNYIGAIASNGTFSVGSVDELMTKMVWSYVELKAHEILTQVDPNY
jgi:hypothetical protein